MGESTSIKLEVPRILQFETSTKKIKSVPKTWHFFRNSTTFLRYLIAVFLLLVLLLAFIIAALLLKPKETENDVFIGIEVGFANVDEIKSFVDEVKGYVNLIIVSDLNITRNATVLYDVFDFLHARNLYFIPFMSLLEFVDDPDFFQVARQRWDEHFLGVYTFDEPGGKQFDAVEHRPIDEAENYSDAASKYVRSVSEEGLLLWSRNFRQMGNVRLFTSDYALYWFDYKACYNVVFSQFGWNFSRQLHIALCRGAATAHNSDWGAVITWTYRQPPYIESPEELTRDMTLAYQNGAKYILVFNYPTNVTEYGLLTRAHLDAIRDFWNYHKVTPQPTEHSAEIAYVLPPDYGFGFRASNDRIWGLWEPDELSSKIWDDANSLLEAHASKLDIIYETGETAITERYETLIFWNGTTTQNNTYNTNTARMNPFYAQRFNP